VRAIRICEESIDDIREVVSRKMVREVKRYMRMADEIGGVVLFFIPDYDFPESEGIRRRHFVTEVYLFQHFLVGPAEENTRWVWIKVKRTYMSSLGE
jgi:hypothetical protein